MIRTQLPIASETFSLEIPIEYYQDHPQFSRRKTPDIMPAFRTGQRVNYKPVGGRESHTSESVGIIREVSTSNTTMTGRMVEASPEEPRYEIENERTRKRSAVKEANILGPAD